MTKGPLLVKLLRFLKKYQQHFNGQQHKSREPFDMKTYITGLHDNGYFDAKSIIADGNCLLETLLYIQNTLNTDVSSSERFRAAMGLRANIVGYYHRLNPNATTFDGHPIQTAATTQVDMGEDTISVFCLQNRCHAIRFNADLPHKEESMPLNFNFFYNKSRDVTDDTKIALIVMLRGHFVPLTTLRGKHQVDASVFSALRTLMQRYKQNYEPNPRHPYFMEQLDVLEPVLNFRCPITLFETEFRKHLGLSTRTTGIFAEDSSNEDSSNEDSSNADSINVDEVLRRIGQNTSGDAALAAKLARESPVRENTMGDAEFAAELARGSKPRENTSGNAALAAELAKGSLPRNSALVRRMATQKSARATLVPKENTSSNAAIAALLQEGDASMAKENTNEDFARRFAQNPLVNLPRLSISQRRRNKRSPKRSPSRKHSSSRKRSPSRRKGMFDFLKRFTRRRNVEFTNIEKKWMAEGPHIPEHQQKLEANIARHARKAALNRQKQINAEQDEHITTQNMLRHHQRRLRTRYTNV
jgi:hypothetical protein